MNEKKSSTELLPWKTNISLVHSFKRENGKFLPAEIYLEGDKNGSGEHISWFDKLFEGGLCLPDIKTNRVEDKKNIKPITMLIMGPPGSGKSTLAMEICHRLAQIEQNRSKTLSSLYISLDTESERVLDKAKNFGWVDSPNRIWDCSVAIIGAGERDS